jgi:glutamine amidotransferase PdxT
MQDEPWFEALHRFHQGGSVLAGTCAGAILLAREVRPQQPSLGLLDVSIERNAYGRQVDSFEAKDPCGSIQRNTEDRGGVRRGLGVQRPFAP